jgi:hypothetical protein
MRPIWVAGEGDHEGRPYADVVGATLVVALPSRLVLRNIRTRVLL